MSWLNCTALLAWANTQIHFAFLALSFVVCLFAYPLQLAHAKPTLSVKNRVFDVSVEIDSKLRAHPKLYAFILSEAKRYLVNAKNDSAPGYSFGVAYTLRAVAGPYISVVRTSSQETGGAHPQYGVSTLFWDRKSERQVTLADMLIDAVEGGPTLTKLAELVSTGIDADKKRRFPDGDPDPVVLEAKVDALGGATFTPSTIPGKASGLTFYFAPYEVGSFGEGFYVIFVPAAAVAPLFKPGLRNLFAGERSKKEVPLPLCSNTSGPEC